MSAKFFRLCPVGGGKKGQVYSFTRDTVQNFIGQPVQSFFCHNLKTRPSERLLKTLSEFPANVPVFHNDF